MEAEAGMTNTASSEASFHICPVRKFTCSILIPEYDVT